MTLRHSAVLLMFRLFGFPVADALAAQRFEPMRHVFLGGQEVLTWDGGELLVAAGYDIADRSLVVVRESTGARFAVKLDPECYLLEGDDQVADARVLLNCNAVPRQRLLDLRTGISQELKPPDDLGLANIPWQSIGRHWMRGEIHTPQVCHWGGCSIYRNLQTGALRPLYETVPVNLNSRKLTVKGCHTSVGISVHKLTLNRCGKRPRIIYRGRVGRPGYDLLNGEPVKLRDGVVTWATRNGVIGAYRIATGQRALWRVPIDRDTEDEVDGQDISVTRTRRHIYVGVASNWSTDSLPTPINRRAYVAPLRRIGL